jgi:hypothetical protein
MKIKNIFNRVRESLLFLTFALFILVLGCESLDFSDPNGPKLEDAAIQNLVTGVEAGMRGSLNFYIFQMSIFGREGYFFEPADPRFTGELLRGPLDPGGFLINNPWSARYAVVFNCNVLLERAPNEAILSAAEKSGVLGFAKTIKAHQLSLNLNQTFNNGIQLMQSDDPAAPEASRDAAYTELARLLDEGFADLQNAGATFSFQLSAGFSGFNTPTNFAQFNRAVRARVGAHRASLSGSAEEWQNVLNAVAASFINPAGDLNRGVYHVYGTGLGDLTNPIFEVPSASFIKYRAHPTLRDEAEAGDLRFSSKVLDRTGDLDPGFGESNLFSSLAVTVSSSSIAPFPVFRNEELILLRAEANIGSGNFGSAEGDLNIVRVAAGLAPYSGTDASNALDRLLHERRYSLFSEGHRWVDLRRYNRLGQLPIDRAGDQVFMQWPLPVDELPGQ